MGERPGRVTNDGANRPYILPRAFPFLLPLGTNRNWESVFRPADIFLPFADHAEAIDRQLYLMGGAWDSVRTQKMPTDHAFAIAVCVLVDPSETNVPHELVVGVVDHDSGNLAYLSGMFTLGRPWNLNGEKQTMLTVHGVQVKIDRPGDYAAIARVGNIDRITLFRVVNIQSAAIIR